MENRWYLKETAYFEPLVNHWYAWTHLIAPATCARHVVATQKRIMTSFVNNFHLHQLVSQEKDIVGSDYLNLDESKLPVIRQLIAELNDRCAELIDLSNAIRDLDELVRGHVSGESIEGLYAQVPEALKGYVELYMDIEHQPGYRLIEALMYIGPYYKPALQSLSFGLLRSESERPFVFSTPRLADEQHAQCDVAFNDPIVDKIFRSREHPLSDNELTALLSELTPRGGLALQDLFIEQAPVRRHQPVESGVRLTYTGHAGFMLESSRVSILIDPVIACRFAEPEEDMFSFSELPAKINYTCLTHSHHDHVNLETLLQLRYKLEKILVPKNNGGTLIDPSIRLILQQLQLDAFELEDLAVTEIPGGRIVAIPFLGEHGDLNIRSKTAWYIELEGRKFFFGADSSNPEIKMYELLAQKFGDLDVMAIGMECVGAPYTWLYGALTTKVVSKTIKNSRRLNGSDCRQAQAMIKALHAKQVIVYALGRERCFKYFMGLEYDENSRQLLESESLLAFCQEKGIPAKSMYGRNMMHFQSDGESIEHG